MDKKAKASHPRLGQWSGGPFLASWVISVCGPSAADMNPLLTMSETHCRHSATRVPHWLEWRGVPQHSKVILVNPEFPMTGLMGFTSLKPLLVFGFPSESSRWTPHGSHHPHQVPYCHYCRKGRATRILFSPFRLSHFPLTSSIRQQPRLQPCLHIQY